MSEIKSVQGRQILDSRGNPTVEAEITRIMASVQHHPFPQELQLEAGKLWNFEIRINLDF